MNVLALDLGGSHIGCALVSGGRVLASSRLPTDAQSFTRLLPALRAELLGHCRTAGIAPEGCAGLGIGVPSIVDSVRGEILSSFNKFTDLNGPELIAWSKAELGVPAKLENDAKLALLGEHAAGAGRGTEDLVMVTLGTGIGVAAMLQNRLLTSRLGQAGCVGGHLTVEVQGRPCICGNLGCAEAEASTWALPALCSARPGFAGSLLAREEVLDFAAVFRACDAGDAVANAVLSRCLDVWAALATSLVHAYGPQRILFGGGVMQRGDAILPHIRDFVQRHSWQTSRGGAVIEAASLGESAAFIGAETLFQEDVA